MKRFAHLVAATLIGTSMAYAERWTLVEFGHDPATTQTPYPEWTEVLRHPTRSQFVNPDGNPAHSGITATPGLGWDAFSYFGIRGTAPIAFEAGHEIILTFYNRADYDSLPTVRISFNDPDEPNPDEPEYRWYTAYNIDINIDTAWAPAGELTELRYTIQDESMLAAIDGIPSTGAHYMVNVSFAENAGGEPPLVLTKIELSDEADLTPPTQPQNLRAERVSLSPGAPASVVKLTWDPSTDPGEHATGVSRYYIYRNAELYDVITPEKTVYLGTNLFYLDTCAAPGSTNTYAIAAIDRAQFGLYPKRGRPFTHPANQSAWSAPITVTNPPWNSATLINAWTDLNYSGAFRMPEIIDPLEASWAYANAGLAWYPDGHPDYDPAHELPGSLYAISYVQRGVGAVSIPRPVLSGNKADLPRARTLIPINTNIWPRIYDGWPFPGGEYDQPVASLAYHPGGNGVSGRLYYGVCTFYATDPDAPSHGWMNLDLTASDGAWHIGGLPPANVCPSLTARFMCPIPQAWADAHTGGRSMLVGNTFLSGGPENHNGPNLFAIAPWASGSLPAAGAALPATAMLQYSPIGTISNQVVNWLRDRFAEGAAWIEADGKQALLISYRRPMGDSWYGDAAGNNITFYNIPAAPAGGEGIGATYWRTEFMLYNPDDLAAVVRGDIPAWQPQPYMTYDVSRFSWISNRVEAMSGAIGTTTNGWLFYIEENGDVDEMTGENAMIHAWRTTADDSPPPPEPSISPVTDLRATAASNAVNLTWANPTNATWVETVVQRRTDGYPVSAGDGLRIYTGIGTQTVDLAVTGGGTYYYSAFGRDAATNWSAATAESRAMATVPAAPPPDDGPASSVIVLQNGGGDDPAYTGCEDAFIASFQATYQNVGAAEEIRLYRADGGNEQYRILIRFDLSSLPAATRVRQAVLGLHQYHFEGDPPPHTVAAYRLTRAWDEGTGLVQFQSDHLGVSWEEAANGIAWTTLGGDYDAATDFGQGANGIVDAPTLTTAVETWQEWDVTALVNAWITGTFENHGLLLISTAGEWNEHYFRSSEHPTIATRPRLTLGYGDGGGGPVARPTVEPGTDDDPANLRLAFDGLSPEQAYQIQTTAALTPPPPLWTATHTFTATGAVYTWSETISGIVTSRFYRLVRP